MKCRIAAANKLKKARQEACFALSPVAILSMLYVGEFKLHFGREKLRKLALKVSDRYDDLSQKYISFDDLKECLREVDGVEIPFSMDFQACNTLDDAKKIAEYTQKAFATSVFASVLVDKFGFHSVKAQQAVKQLCDVFDKMKDSPKTIRTLQERYYEEYEVKVC